MADEEPEREERGASDAQLLGEIQARDTEVMSHLKKKDKIRALVASLQNPPVTTKSVNVKDTNAAVVEKVLTALTDAECQQAVDALDADGCDILMKYLYRFMSRSSNCQTSLKLHALLTEKAGHGCIVRALTDRKTV